MSCFRHKKLFDRGEKNSTNPVTKSDDIDDDGLWLAQQPVQCHGNSIQQYYQYNNITT